MSTPTCRDCLAAGITTWRPTPHAAGRCYTHHLAARKAAKARAHDTRVAKTYGLAPGDYDRLYLAQGGKCAICRVATGKTKRLAVDHDHETGEVRGLLCTVCNRILIGRYGVEALSRALSYLLAPPARAVLKFRRES